MPRIPGGSVLCHEPLQGLNEVYASTAIRKGGRTCFLQRNLLIYGLGGVIVPFVGIKLIDLIITALHLI